RVREVMSRRASNWLAVALVLSLTVIAGASLFRSQGAGTARGGPSGADEAQGTAKKGSTIDPKDRPEVNLFLIGDAGAPSKEHEPVLMALQKALSEDAQRSTVVFLG